ncbi:MAG: hypothetical protein LBF15_06285 [Candidatus Peribacteria bacterium]|nr:hypothetical protein [Candidatus Peribacteria bacterium]
MEIFTSAFPVLELDLSLKILYPSKVLVLSLFVLLSAKTKESPEILASMS